jgi:ZIP family zinc transporter
MIDPLFDWLRSFHPVLQALVATLFTWMVTAFGASLVFGARTVNQKVMDGMPSLASGVMIAASFWSLLAPAIEMSGGAWHQAFIGFLAGGQRQVRP